MMFETPKLESIDIDDQAGWDVAEAIARQRLQCVAVHDEVLVTCPPMLRNLDEFRPRFEERAIDVAGPHGGADPHGARADLSCVPGCDGWIIGDDPATRAVFAAGKAGQPQGRREVGRRRGQRRPRGGRASWASRSPTRRACSERKWPTSRWVTSPRWPGSSWRSIAAFGPAAGRSPPGFHSRAGPWRWSGTGISAGTRRAGCSRPRCACSRTIRSSNRVPHRQAIEVAAWPDRVEEADFIVLTCALTPETRHMLDAATFSRSRRGVRVVNVARGALIDEARSGDSP